MKGELSKLKTTQHDKYENAAVMEKHIHATERFQMGNQPSEVMRIL